MEVLALASVVRSFGVSLSPPESLMLLGLASLSTLVPTAPGYVGTYQLVFGMSSTCSAIRKRPESSRQPPFRFSASAR